MVARARFSAGGFSAASFGNTENLPAARKILPRAGSENSIALEAGVSYFVRRNARLAMYITIATE